MLMIGNLDTERENVWNLIALDHRKWEFQSLIRAFFNENHRHMFLQFKILGWISDLICFIWGAKNGIVHFSSQNPPENRVFKFDGDLIFVDCWFPGRSCFKIKSKLKINAKHRLCWGFRELIRLLLLTVTKPNYLSSKRTTKLKIDHQVFPDLFTSYLPIFVSIMST